jgi:hypothetical protein
MKRYTYLGDRMTDLALKGQACSAVLLEDGKCIRGRNGSMLIRFDAGQYTRHSLAMAIVIDYGLFCVY